MWPLLERDESLRQFEAALVDRLGGHGRVAPVSGDAGIGKPTLVQRFVTSRPRGRARSWTAPLAVCSADRSSVFWRCSQSSLHVPPSPSSKIFTGPTRRRSISSVCWPAVSRALRLDSYCR